MPELPEVQTVVNGLNERVIGKKIKKVWTDYKSDFYKGKESIKDSEYFEFFKKEIIDLKIIKAKRRAKNIIIELEKDKIILVHLKMTGHFLFGEYSFDAKKNIYIPKGGFVDREKLKKDKSGDLLSEIEHFPLRDPFNKFIHFAIEFESGEVLALSDMRKFASVQLTNKENIKKILEKIGPEPFDADAGELFEKIKKNKYKNKKIKTILMDPEFIAGIGNIYSDEILWEVGIHPETLGNKITQKQIFEMLEFAKKIFQISIDIGGDSMSDFRNIEGRKGEFQNEQKAYKLENTQCQKIINGKRCKGILEKKIINGRVGRFCPVHQIKF